MSISLASWSGGGIKLDVTADMELRYAIGRCQNLNITVSGRSLYLPNAMTIPRGWPAWILWNSGTQSATIRDQFSTSLGTLGTDQVARIGLADSSITTGTWIIEISSAF